MKKLMYYFVKVISILLKKPNLIIKFYRKMGMTIGDNNQICGYLNVNEPQLVEIKNDCIFSSDISLITHDHSIYKVTDKGSNLFGKITIGNNCFIGQGSTIMYGVEIGDNIIVGSGSVVTKSFNNSNMIIAGNPAREIGTWDQFLKKYADKAAFRNELAGILDGSIDKNVRR